MVEKIFNRMGSAGFACAALGFVGTNFIFVVDGGERALIMDAFKGVKPHVYGEGMHFRMPIIQTINRFEVRSRPHFTPSTTGTKDLQTVTMAIRVLFRPQEQKLPEILTNIGKDYETKVLPSIIGEVVKSTVAQYNAEQLISQREKVSKEIREVLGRRAMEFDIILDDVSITDLQFSRDFAQSIEQKQVAQQMAERAKFIVFKREEETKAAVLRAEGEAEAAKLVADAISDFGPGLVAMRKIEAAAHIADVLKVSSNVTFLSGNTLNMLNISGGSGI